MRVCYAESRRDLSMPADDGRRKASMKRRSALVLAMLLAAGPASADPVELATCRGRSPTCRLRTARLPRRASTSSCPRVTARTRSRSSFTAAAGVSGLPGARRCAIWVRSWRVGASPCGASATAVPTRPAVAIPAPTRTSLPRSTGLQRTRPPTGWTSRGSCSSDTRQAAISRCGRPRAARFRPRAPCTGRPGSCRAP